MFGTYRYIMLNIMLHICDIFITYDFPSREQRNNLSAKNICLLAQQNYVQKCWLPDNLITYIEHI